MGQKINPTGFRLPVTRNWTSRWYAVGRDFSRTLGEDLAVRSFLLKKLRNASVSRILIERPANNARITIFSARPGIVIGKQGADIEALKAEVQKMMGVPVHVNIEEVRIIKKALESAIANAEHNDGADIDTLVVTKIHVEKAATLRRFAARAKGRGTRINKQTSHIYISVGDAKAK